MSLPFKKVSPLIKKASIDFELGLETVSEFGITLVGKHFLARNTRIILEHEILNKITGRDQVILTVSKNWIDHERNIIGSELLFDQEDGRLLTNVRQWLAQNSRAE